MLMDKACSPIAFAACFYTVYCIIIALTISVLHSSSVTKFTKYGYEYLYLL